MIELRNLTVDYEDKRAVSDFSAVFKNGNLTVLSAPNGGGKSSLLRAVAGLQEKTSGEILIDGADSSSITRNELAKKITYMAQNRNTPNIQAKRMVLHGRFPYLSYPRRYRKEDFEAAQRALIEADAADIADKFVPDLSGGQRQRVYLAMALAQDTNNILLDEPLNFLDVRHQLELMSLAKRLTEDGKAVVMVIHDIRLAMQEADEIAVMNKGELAYFGTPDDIYETDVIDEVFGIGLEYVETPLGRRYYYR